MSDKPRGTPRVEEIVRRIHAWVEVNASRESVLLYGPAAAWTVDPVALLDFIYEISGVEKRALTDAERDAERKP